MHYYYQSLYCIVAVCFLIEISHFHYSPSRYTEQNIFRFWDKKTTNILKGNEMYIYSDAFSCIELISKCFFLFSHVSHKVLIYVVWLLRYDFKKVSYIQWQFFKFFEVRIYFLYILSNSTAIVWTNQAALAQNYY